MSSDRQRIEESEDVFQQVLDASGARELAVRGLLLIGPLALAGSSVVAAASGATAPGQMVAPALSAVGALAASVAVTVLALAAVADAMEKAPVLVPIRAVLLPTIIGVPVVLTASVGAASLVTTAVTPGHALLGADLLAVAPPAAAGIAALAFFGWRLAAARDAIALTYLRETV